VKSSLIFSILLFATNALAQVSVSGLYDLRSRVPGILIPFKVIAESNSVSVLNAIAQPEDGADCRTMLDPFRKDIFLLKCTAETKLLLRVQVSNGNKYYAINYGPVIIANLAEDLTPIDSDQPQENSQILAGRQLYNTYCINCHNPPSVKAKRTFNQIKSSLTAVPTMTSLSRLLSEDDITKLTAYLGSL
jgi:mono/diheme cytochrome c family protein